MLNKFMNLHIALRIILLLPFVGWFTEVIIRWFDFAETKNKGALVLAIVFTLVGWIGGVVDMIVMLVTGKLLQLDL